MSKPDWKDAPDWANWLAQDADGEWFWWKAKPKISGGQFWMPSRYPATYARALRSDPNQGWKDTLESRP